MPRDKRISQVEYYLRAKYNMILNEYVTAYRTQKGRCAICQHRIRNMLDPLSTGRRPAIDHNHKTGHTRKLLCHQCNAGLGLLGDSVRLLAAAILYLEDHEDETEVKIEPEVQPVIRLKTYSNIIRVCSDCGGYLSRAGRCKRCGKITRIAKS